MLRLWKAVPLYEEGMLEEWIVHHIIREAKKYPSDIQLQRSVKLKSICI